MAGLPEGNGAVAGTDAMAALKQYTSGKRYFLERPLQ
jgi:hypothetical protein